MTSIGDMLIGSDEWRDILHRGAERMGMGVTEFQALQFSRHAQLLMQWNQKINLTAITDPMQVAIKHYLDAIAPLNHIPADGRLLDIGTGGGFPGIPLKIMRPAQPMTLIDSVRKKITFVKSAIHLLGLKQIEARHLRAQDVQLQNIPELGFKAIVCRALANLEAVAAMAIPLLADEGRIVVYQSTPGSDETSGAALEPIMSGRHRRLQVYSHSYQLPYSGDQRSVAVIRVDKHE